VFVDPRWVVVVVFASLTYGILSPVIAARRLLFLAGALPHTALLSAVLALILSKSIGGAMELWSVIACITFTLLVALLLSKGVEPDTATAIFVSLSISLTVISIYYVLTTFPIEVSLWAYILGDPLLVSWRDVYYMVAISLIVLTLIVPFLREHVLIGVDRDFVRLSGVKTIVYDVAFMVSLALATVGLLKAVGFVVEHVMLLLPGTIAAMIACSGKETIVLGLLVSLLGGLIGLTISLIVGLAPSGLIGLILLSFYLLSLSFKRG